MEEKYVEIIYAVMAKVWNKKCYYFLFTKTISDNELCCKSNIILLKGNSADKELFIYSSLHKGVVID